MKIREKRKNALADAVASGITIRAASAQTGISLGYARNLWSEIVRDLGWQAA